MSGMGQRQGISSDETSGQSGPIVRALGRLRMTQVKSSRAESIGSVWPAEDASLGLRHVLPGGLEMKLQSRADCGLLVLQKSQMLRRRCIWQEGGFVQVRVSVHAQAPSCMHVCTVRQVRSRYLGKHRAVGTQRRLADYQSSVRINNSLQTVFSSLCK